MRNTNREWARHQKKYICPLAYNLVCSRHAYTAGLQWNKVSNLLVWKTRPSQYATTASFAVKKPFHVLKPNEEQVLKECENSVQSKRSLSRIK
ncbi:hypothetical protein AVEN_176070-1 [Araneus ventricosus]|uniref:Uncharacterized protein n=1 Tax=Araneus ventricosus TaxID=182803 RepID=A0A4Y2F6B7_ARAVE|nr:hypothetical protein AVEN_176070-1 [Araneus ventricosus]